MLSFKILNLLCALFYVRLFFCCNGKIGVVSRVITCGGCDLLALSVRSHVSSCDDVTVWASRLLFSLVMTLDAVNAQDRSACQDKLAGLELPGLLFGGLSERLGGMSKLAVQWVLKAIGCLARRHESNAVVFVQQLGLCELLRDLQDQVDLGKDEKLSESVCWVIGNTSFPYVEAQLRWTAAGACEVILAALNFHVNSEETVQGWKIFPFFFFHLFLCGQLRFFPVIFIEIFNYPILQRHSAHYEICVTTMK
jgi:hypothetical protein